MSLKLPFSGLPDHTVIHGSSLQNRVNQTIIGMSSASGVSMSQGQDPWEEGWAGFGDNGKEGMP